MYKQRKKEEEEMSKQSELMFTRKMILVPYGDKQNLETHDDVADINGEKRLLSHMNNEMNDVLSNDELSDREKQILYNDLLRKLMFFREGQRKAKNQGVNQLIEVLKKPQLSFNSSSTSSVLPLSTAKSSVKKLSFQSAIDNLKSNIEDKILENTSLGDESSFRELKKEENYTTPQLTSSLIEPVSSRNLRQQRRVAVDNRNRPYDLRQVKLFKEEMKDANHKGNGIKSWSFLK